MEEKAHRKGGQMQSVYSERRRFFAGDSSVSGPNSTMVAHRAPLGFAEGVSLERYAQVPTEGRIEAPASSTANCASTRMAATNEP
jgi:hypothetical protein